MAPVGARPGWRLAKKEIVAVLRLCPHGIALLHLLAQLLHLLHELALVLGHTPERRLAKRAPERMQAHTEHVERTQTES